MASIAIQTDDFPPTQPTSSLAKTQTYYVLQYKYVAVQTDDDIDVYVFGNIQEEQENEQEEELDLCDRNPDESLFH